MLKRGKMAVALLLILVLSIVVLPNVIPSDSNDEPIVAAWYGDTDYSCPPWTSNQSWDGDGWYCQCHHRDASFGCETDCWVATGLKTHYHPLLVRYMEVCWSWCSSVGSPDNWIQFDACYCDAEVVYNYNPYYSESNTYQDIDPPQWQYIFDLYGYTRSFEYWSTEFNPPILTASGRTSQIFESSYWTFYFVSSESEPWDCLTAHYP